MAIPFTTVATIRAASEGYTFRSELFPEARQMSSEDRSEGVGNWSDYPVGVLRQLQLKGIEPPPFELHLRGNVPFGAGLSSSASVEVAIAMALLAHADATMEPAEIALLCQRAENVYVHSPCGIMDQFVITAAKAGHALLLHTRELTVEHIPMNRGELAEMSIVVCNSMVKHSIAAGDYGQRRKELEAGQAVLREAFADVHDLSEATLEQLERCEGAMSAAAFKRCRHVVSENARTRAARQAMIDGDAKTLGQLMTKAHASERDDFECSCEEVDFLVDTAIRLDGCLGARLTGGGFGGCIVALVAREKADAFVPVLQAAYKQRYNIQPDAYVCEAVDGAVERAAKQGQGRTA